jgi:hypothetical protein
MSVRLLHSRLTTNYHHTFLIRPQLCSYYVGCDCPVPACARPARLHPAGALGFESSHSLQKQGTLGREPISLLLCWPLLGSPEAASWRAAPASGSQLDSDIVRAMNSHLNVVTRGRAPDSSPEEDLLYSTSRGCCGS